MPGWRLGWNVHDMNRADGLEIYISQGAKPGLGGQLMAKKLRRRSMVGGRADLLRTAGRRRW